MLAQRWETEIGWCQHRGGRQRLDNTEARNIDWMVLHRLDGANTEAGDIDWMVLHRLDGANTQA